MSKKSRRGAGPALSSVAVADRGEADVPVVGGREPCPCGSGKRYRLCHGRMQREQATRLVARPFAGLPGECDWVALRQIVPAATMTVVTTAEYGSLPVTVATVLPMAWPGLRRLDGSILLGLQTAGGSGDASRDVCACLLRAIEAEPGMPIPEDGLPGPGPRLQDVLDLSAPLEITVHAGFDFWLQEGQQVEREVRESMERANASVVPTQRLTSVDAAYWCRVGDRGHLRWVMAEPEAEVLDGLARLQAAGTSSLLDGTRYVGSFRADGVLVPVWDLPSGTVADELEEPARRFAVRLRDAMALTDPLTPDERRARAGVVSRQVTLR